MGRILLGLELGRGTASMQLLGGVHAYSPVTSLTSLNSGLLGMSY